MPCTATRREGASEVLLRLPLPIHGWKVSPNQARAIQADLADRVLRRGRAGTVRLVAGLDCGFRDAGRLCVGGVVLWDVQAGRAVEHHLVARKVRFPYLPGLLSFREAPTLLSALRRLREAPDLLMCDGQGYAHPRRFGLACHLGVWMGLPAIGCAKSILVGKHGPLRAWRGERVPLRHDGEIVGMALRPRDGVKPVYVSVGHKVSLSEAVKVVLACFGGFRLPEPTRRADRLVASFETTARAASASRGVQPE